MDIVDIVIWGGIINLRYNDFKIIRVKYMLL